MTQRKPLVFINGIPQNLPAGDTISGAGGSSGNVDFVVVFAGNVSTAQTGYQTLANFRYDPADHSGATVTFEALLEVTSGSVTATLQLYNRTDDTQIAILTTTATSPTYVTVSATMNAAAKTYAVRLKQTGGGPTDMATCTMARLRIV